MACLDEKGRCCGRKPIEYKSRWSTSDGPHRFCDRCCRAYHLTENHQIENWAWEQDAKGEWVDKLPGNKKGGE